MCIWVYGVWDSAQCGSLPICKNRLRLLAVLGIKFKLCMTHETLQVWPPPTSASSLATTGFLSAMLAFPAGLQKQLAFVSDSSYLFSCYLAYSFHPFKGEIPGLSPFLRPTSAQNPVCLSEPNSLIVVYQHRAEQVYPLLLCGGYTSINATSEQ